MRMWMVDPAVLCRQHLLGEHVECHMFMGTLLKGISIRGYVEDGLVETDQLHARHDALVREMVKRGYNHRSPMPHFKPEPMGVVSISKSLLDLHERCEDCRSRIDQASHILVKKRAKKS